MDRAYLTLVFHLLAQVLKPHAPNRVLVRFRATVLSVEEEDRSLGLRLAHVGKSTKSYASGATDFSRNHVPIAYDIIDGMSVEKKVEQLKKRADVAVAEPDYEIELYKTPSDSLYQNQWHHRVVGNDKAWDVTTGSADVKVCVIDSGVDMNHPDVAGNILKGWNVVPLSDGKSYPTPGSAEWANFDDSLGHGTHVAGLVGAVSNNARGVTGGAWKVGLLPCRFITASGAGYISDAITCIRLCQEEGAHIYSNSWGGVGYSEILHDEIKKLNSENALFVVAAGNNNGLDLDRSPLYPASYKESNVLTIGSTTSTNLMSAFSNIGRSTVHLAAPGSSIYSTTNDGEYGVMSGTSMAAPIVCGAAALLKSIALKAGYDLQPAEIKSLLVETATPFQDGSKYTISGGRLNTYEAVKKLGLKIPKEADVVPGLPKNPENIPQDPSPEAGESSTDAAPQCGTTSIRGRPATQSSTYKKYLATYGNNGDCRHNARRHAKSCAITDPKRSYPWWTAPLPKQDVVTSVTITTRADCCSSSITGANIMVGNQTWDGSGDRKRFSLCGKVPSKVKRGSPIVIQCTTPLKGTNVAVYLPKKRTALSICEVDVSLQSDANGKQTKKSNCRKNNPNNYI